MMDSDYLTGTFIVAYGIISVKIKSEWYLGEACMYRTNKTSMLRVLTRV